ETKYSTALSGKNDLNSPKSWAASVLFGEMTRVGRWMFAITLAIVKVFPDPVTPSSTTWRRPSWTRRVSRSIARGWSPRGSYSACSLKAVVCASRPVPCAGRPRRAGGPAAPRRAPQVAEGTATRYFRQESRKDTAWGCRRRWTEKRNRGCTGSRIRRIPASSSSRFPLRRLHLRQAATTFVQVVSPPRDRGSTWSTVRRSPRRLQYWHAYPSRRRMFFLLKATRSRNGLRM